MFVSQSLNWGMMKDDNGGDREVEGLKYTHM